MTGLRIERWGTGYAVMGDNTRLTGVIRLHALAQHRLDQIERQRKLRQRPCLCCGQTFASEGPHNRLCDPCRDDASGVAA